ncbi:MAG: glycosyl hydrolase [Blastococcus sp.]
MPLSSPMTRRVRNGLLVTTTATAAVALVLALSPAADPVASAAGSAVFVADPSVSPAATAAARAHGTAADADAADRAARTAAAHIARSHRHASGSSAAGSSAAGSGETLAAGSPAPGAGGPSTGDRIVIGSVAGGYQQALAGTGVPLADHAYAFFTGNVPQAEMITVSAASTPWREVAAAGPGSTLYGQIVHWAQTIKARGGAVMVAYNHEPEGHDRLELGSAADFIAAYRHVETIFDQQGASNVVWTWQMTAYAFRTNPSSDQYAAKWYPGDDWIDNVGADAYNWFTCGAGSNGQYSELQQIGDPVLAFARAHGKKASFPEFASHANANRTQWLSNAHQYFVRNQDILTAAFYFNRPPTVAANADCRWGLTSTFEYGALRQMAQDTAHFTV